MSPRTIFSRQFPSARRGFSLIELMIVIVIISILMALLLPAIGSVRTTLRNTEVRTEISGFEAGITQFVGEFGQEPPSKITLYEDGASWDVQNRTLVRQLWPQFNFDAIHNDSSGNPLTGRDLNGDNDAGDTFILTGDECLLFFLGGPDTITDTATPTDMPVADGFSKNPQDPFASGGTRTGPFQEFGPDRMIDDDGDGAHAYAHKIPASQVPYLYLSSYGGRGYRPADADLDGNGTPDITDVYLTRIDDTSTPENEKVPWKAKTYQIISSGFDGVFGIGGLWSNGDGFTNNTGDTSDDRDNITNFSSGTLE